MLTVRGMAAAVVSRGVFSVRLPGEAAQAWAVRLAFELIGVSKDVNFERPFLFIVGAWCGC